MRVFSCVTDWNDCFWGPRPSEEWGHFPKSCAWIRKIANLLPAHSGSLPRSSWGLPQSRHVRSLEHRRYVEPGQRRSRGVEPLVWQARGYRTNIVSSLWNATVRANFPRSHKGLKSRVQMNKPKPKVKQIQCQVYGPWKFRKMKTCFNTYHKQMCKITWDSVGRDLNTSFPQYPTFAVSTKPGPKSTHQMCPPPQICRPH